MENDLQREKSAMQRIWKVRERQIEKAKYNTIEMFGNIKGIAGSVVQDIKLLDLDMMALLPEEGE